MATKGRIWVFYTRMFVSPSFEPALSKLWLTLTGQELQLNLTTPDEFHVTIPETSRSIRIINIS